MTNHAHSPWPGWCLAAPRPRRPRTVELWTVDPCDAHSAGAPMVSDHYFGRLQEARARLCPWMADALGYASSAGLEVLDAGCGQGIDLANLAWAGARAVGLD